MKALGIAGIVLFISGFLFCAAPNLIVKLNQWGKRLLFTDEGTIKYNLRTGVIFMIVGAIVFFVSWYYGRILAR